MSILYISTDWLMHVFQNFLMEICLWATRFVYRGSSTCTGQWLRCYPAAPPLLAPSFDIVLYFPKSKVRVSQFVSQKFMGYGWLWTVKMFFSKCRCKQWMSDSAFCARLTYISPEDVAKLPGAMPEGRGWKHKFGNMIRTKFNQEKYILCWFCLNDMSRKQFN